MIALVRELFLTVDHGVCRAGMQLKTRKLNSKLVFS